jgi:flagellar FliL protein
MAKSKESKKDEKPAGAEPEEGAEGEASEQPEAPKRRFPGKKLVLFVGAPLLLLVLVGAGAHFAGLTKRFFGSHEAEQAEAKPEPPKPAVFYNLPEMLVNLNSAGRRTSFLKISVSLELDTPADIPRIEAVMPRIVDNFQIYLRELRVEDLRGSAGLYRLREELLARVNTAAQPARVNDVLFKEMLVQ